MKYSKWIGILAVAVLIVASFQPWVYVVSKDLTITGLHTEGTNFGRPALLNIIMSCIAAVFFMVPRLMAKRANIFFCAFNLAWAFRNFLLISMCRGGECPQKQTGIYMLLIAAVIIMLAALFPDIKLKEEKNEE